MNSFFKRRLSMTVVTCVFAFFTALSMPAFSERGPQNVLFSAPSEDPAGARVIVKYKTNSAVVRSLKASVTPRALPQHATTLAKRTGLLLRDGHALDARTQVVHGDTTMSSAELAKKLSSDSEVEYAVPDLRRHAFLVPNDPLYAATSNPLPAVSAGQWYLHPFDSTLISAINAEAAWDITTGLSSLVVADVDTGVLFNHPDLVNKLLPGRNFISTNGNVGDGWSDDASDTGDFTASDECGSGQAAQSSSWHGTQTASIIAAQSNDGIGMASVGYDVKVLPVRVLGPCGGYDSDIIAGMLWAANLSSNPVVNPTPAKIINLSLGGSGACTAAYVDAMDQLAAAGVIVVVAAGNDEGLAVGVPANCPGAFAVAGVRHIGTKVGFSNIGPEIAIAAPAGNCVNTTGACLYPIITATNTGSTAPDTTPSGYTYTDSMNPALGTSFSAPMVSGAAALILSANPVLTATQVKNILKNNARPFPAQPSGSTVPLCHAPNSTAQEQCYCTTSTCGAGLLDVGSAVLAATVIDTSQPQVNISASDTAVIDGGNIALTSNAVAVNGKNIATYLWTISEDSNIASFSGSTNAATADVITSGVGSFTVTLTVTDSAGLSVSESINILVNPPAVPSVIIVPSATAVPAGSDITFDGSASASNAPATIASYQWSIIHGEALATFTSATDTNTVTVSTLGNKSGSLTVRLTVTDSLGQQVSSNSTVNIMPVAPTANIAVSALTVTAGTNVNVDGSGSLASAGRSITNYQWEIVGSDGVATFNGSTTGATATINTLAAGSIGVRLTVTDSLGVQSTETTIVTVNAKVAVASSTTSSTHSKGGGAISLGWLLVLLISAIAFVRLPLRCD